tara:strand:- start:79 stop:1245 length:1167 start_codon:yes stop_codon:yes gene_type:complete
MVLKQIAKLFQKTPERYLEQAKCLINKNQFRQAEKKLWRGIFFFPESSACTESLLKLIKIDEKPRQFMRLSNIILSRNPLSKNGLMHKALSLLILGKKTKATHVLKTYFKSEDYPRSRFLNGLSHLNKNPRKLLWASSFHTYQGLHTQRNDSTNFQPFQYWSQGSIPNDIAIIQEAWNTLLSEIDLPRIILFNKDSARSWIQSHAPELTQRFDNAPLFAMEADIFRIAYATKNDCIWIDSDEFPRTATSRLLKHWTKRCDTLFLFRWNRPWISNSFFMTKKSSPFFLDLEQSIQSYQLPDRPIRRKDVLNSYGPGLYNKQLNLLLRRYNFSNHYNRDLPEKALIDCKNWRYAFTNEKIFCALKPPCQLEYTNTLDSWHQHVDQSGRST